MRKGSRRLTEIPVTTRDLPCEWLTGALRRSNTLPNGEVTGIVQRDNAAFNSQVSHLALSYSVDAPETAPARLLLKLKNDHNGKQEAAFYRMAHAAEPLLHMLVRCYGVDYSEQTGNSYLLLEDVSETHTPRITHGQHIELNYLPTQDHLDGIVGAIGSFHARFWQYPLVHQEGALFAVTDWYGAKAGYEHFVARRHQHWAHFVEMEGGRLPDDLRRLYERTLGSLPTLWKRFLEPRIATGRQLTLTYGDCYLGQFLCPKDPSRHETIMLDLDSACMDFEAMDLVYLFATFWTPEQRAEGGREEKALRQYYETLLDHGVQDYRWDDLLRDYRFMLTLMIFHPVWDQTYLGSNNSYWWAKMQCLTGAYLDWDCKTLLT